MAPRLTHLRRLCRRMDELSFPADHPLYRSATRARDAMQGVLEVAADLAVAIRDHSAGMATCTMEAVKT